MLSHHVCLCHIKIILYYRACVRVNQWLNECMHARYPRSDNGAWYCGMRNQTLRQIFDVSAQAPRTPQTSIQVLALLSTQVWFGDEGVGMQKMVAVAGVVMGSCPVPEMMYSELMIFTLS